MNVKVRWRTRTLKVKQLVERADDGFELWRTRLITRLPIARRTWDEIAETLSLEVDKARLAGASDPEEVIVALCNSASAVGCADVVKERSSFGGPSAHVELAEVIVAESTLRSVAFESADLTAARALRSKLAEDRLGTPENYVALCRRIALRTP